MEKEQYLSLVDKANKAASAYYDNDDPLISDYDYDALIQSIRSFEAQHPEQSSSNSPTRRIAGTSGKSTFAKVSHKVPMLSLQDVFTREEVSEFLSSRPTKLYSVEHKIDGLSMSVTYENGVLTRAETRGDGFIGEDVTENARFVRGIPKSITKAEELEVRCEVYLPVDSFLKLNAEKEDNGEKLFANPRNAAAGLLRTSDINAMKDAGLCAFAFNVQRFKGTAGFGLSHLSDLALLQTMGFSVVCARPAKTEEEVLSIIDTIRKEKDALPYWIDGAVVKINDIKERAVLGEAGKYPRWAVAFKYPPEEKETTITDIVLQTGRTGRVTPVAIFNPVFLAGTKVEKATLHNPEMIESLGINIGSAVIVRKAAEIIPEIVKAKNRTKDIYNVLSHKCPSCGGDLVQGADENGNNACGAYCENPNCPAQRSRYFEFWCSRDVMGIDGFGPSVINRLSQLGFLSSIPDIYKLQNHKNDILKADGFGEKGVRNLLDSIEKSKTKGLERLIKALGIPGIGKTIGLELAKKYPDIWTISKLSEEELLRIQGIGEISARLLCEWMRKKENLDMLAELEGLGVNMKSIEESEKNGEFVGESVVITGTLACNREEAESILRENGAQIGSSVTRKTTLLIVGENPGGTKLTKANSLRIPIIDEKQMWERIGERK